MSAVAQVKQLAWRLYHVDENSKATDIGLLIIRITVAVCLFYHHGAEKFYDFHTLTTHNLDPVGIGVVQSVIFAGFTDGVCSLLVLFGLFSRYASFFLLICLNTVWWLMDHGLQHLLGLPIPAPVGRGMQGPPIGAGAQHMAQMGMPHFAQVAHSMPGFMNVPMYILGFLVIFIAGPGRYSLDKILEAKMQKKAAVAAAPPAG